MAPEADALTLRQAFRRRSKALHPDTTALPAAEAARQFQQLREAYDLLSWDVNVGDCLVFDFRTLHCVSNKGAPATETQRRVTFRFGADDVIFSPRGEWTKETSDFLIGHGQHVNSPLGCDIIPQVWTRALSQTNEASVEVRNKQVNI